MRTPNPAHIVTGQCRMSYVALTQPKQKGKSGEPRYSVTLLVPKSDIATKQALDMAIEAAAQNGTKEKWGGIRPPIVATPVYDGDGTRPSDGMPFGEECKGHWVFTASSKTAPGIVDQYLQPILQATEIYSGMYGKAGVTFFPYFQEGKKGVGCALDNVQKLADGDPLSGHATAQEDFGGAQPGQQPAYQAPVAPYQPPVPMQPPTAPYQPAAPMQPPAYQQPTPQPYGYGQPPQPPMYQQQAAPTQPAIDPITGRPVGGVYYG